MGAFGEMMIRNMGGDLDSYRGNRKPKTKSVKKPNKPVKKNKTMTIRKVKQLIKIAKEYKMYPLVKYYELKIELIRTENKLEKCKKTQFGTYQDPTDGYVTKY